MPSSTSETKIELVTEAIEALVLATVVAATSVSDKARAMNHQNVIDAREVLSKSLKTAFAPTFRVVRNDIDPGRSMGDRMMG